MLSTRQLPSQPDFCAQPQVLTGSSTIDRQRAEQAHSDRMPEAGMDFLENYWGDRESQFQRLIEAANDVIGVWGLDGRLGYLSPSFQTVFGFDPADWLGRSFEPLVHPDDLPLCLETNQWVAETGERKLGFQFRNRHQQGHWLWVSMSISPLKDSENRVIGFHGILRDVSDLKRQEEALRFIAAGTIAKTGTEFFQCCTQALTEILQVQFAFITQLLPGNTGRSRMVSLWTGDAQIDPYEFDLASTPCEVVLQEGWAIFPNRLQQRFPDASALATLSAESYLAVVIRDPHGNAIGNLGIMDTHPLPDGVDVARSILQIFSTRVGAEMERYAAELRLKSREAQFRSLVENVTSIIFEINREGCFDYLSPHVEVVTGYAPQELLGQPFAVLLHPDDFDRCRLAHQTVIETGATISNIEYRVCSKYGMLQWHTANVTGRRNEETGQAIMLGVAQDITARKAADLALKNHADRQTVLNTLSTQIRNSLDLETVIATALDSIRNLLNITYCAFAWYEPGSESETFWHLTQESCPPNWPSALGRYSNDLVGIPAQWLVESEVLQVDDVTQCENETHRKFLELMNSKSEMLLPMRTMSQRQGVVICVEHFRVRPWRGAEIELLKSVCNQLAIAIDQAELFRESRDQRQALQETLQNLKRTQAQMVQSEKMSSLGQLVAGLAHEINNPVNFIHGNLTHVGNYAQDLMGLVALYQQIYPQSHPAIAQKLDNIDLTFLQNDLPKVLDSMTVGTDRIRDIIKSLRLFSRLDESDVKSIDLHDGLESTLMILKNRLKATNHRPAIQVIKQYGDLSEMECWAGQINQVFMNILVNAIDAIDDAWRDAARVGSQFELGDRLPALQIITMRETTDQGDRATLRFIDNGKGIPAEILPQIFDPFFTTKPVGQGTGMGMSISYQIITEQHQGELLCESTPGTGTEFRIHLPYRQSLPSVTS